MRTGSTRHGHRQAAGLVTLGVLLVGALSAPAHAESTREQQWFLTAMKAEQMWQTSTGKGVTVAVIDTGVDPSNPDLRGRVLAGKDFALDQPGGEHTDYKGHGTSMAGLIAGTGAYGGGIGAFGLAPGSRILPIRMPNDEAAASEAAANRQFSEVLPKAIHYAVDSGARVINISMASEEGTQQMTAEVKYALKKGSLVFAGVGNNGDHANKAMYPAAVPGVVGVAAVGKDLRRTAESEVGPQVDMAAPGEDMVHPCGTETGLCTSHGTSDATALASASAALIWSKHPNWTNNQVLRVMLNTIGGPTDGAKRNDSIGYGIVRPRIALQNPGDPGPADEYPLPDLAASASKGPSSAASQTSGTGASAKKAKSAPAASASKDRSTLWLTLGIAAAVILGVAIAVFAAIRRRRHRTAPPPAQLPYRVPEFTQSPSSAPPSQGPDSA